MYEFIGWTQQQMKQTHTRKSWLAGWLTELGWSLCTVSKRHRIDYRWKSIVSALLYARRHSVHSTIDAWAFLWWGTRYQASHTHTLSVSHSLSLGCEQYQLRGIFGGWQKRARDGEIEWEFSIRCTVYFARLQWHREEEKFQGCVCMCERVYLMCRCWYVGVSIC